MRKKHRTIARATSRTRKKYSLRPRLEQLEARLLMCADGIDDGDDDAPGLLIGTPVPNVTSLAVNTGGTSGGTVVGTGALHPLTDIPVLNSLPGAAVTLYLDFNGHFDASWGSYSNITTPAYDQDGDATTFSDSELQSIQQIWRQVSEDYSPFNINVTTVEPPSFANGVALRVVIGGDGAWTGGAYGGVSYVDSFTNSLQNTSYVFTKNLGNGAPRYTGEAVSHESGHAFGLQHQSTYSGTTKTAEYSTGPGDGTAPIMGNSYYATRGLWWNGQNSLGSTVMQDDMAVISRSANGFGYRPDDYGNSLNTATMLQVVSGSNAVSTAGVITTTSDTDWFSFTSNGGQLSVGAYTASGVNDLDATLQLRDANGNVLASSDPTTSFDATLDYTLGAGQYFLVVGSHGHYGDVGQYTLAGTVPVGVLSLTAPSNLAANATSTSQVNLTWSDNSSGESGFQVQLSTDSINWTDVATTPANTTSYQVTGLNSGTAYQFRVRATATGVTSTWSTAASATTLTPTAPTDPGSLTAGAVSPTQINLTWSDNSNNETGFLVERSTDGTNWTQIGTAAANATSYQATGLAAATNYYFRVRATNSGLNSGYTSTASATTFDAPTVPNAPSGLVGNAYGTRKVILYWQDNADNEQGIRIQRSTNGTAWTTVGTVAPDSTSYVDSTVVKNKAYQYRVVAYNDVGTSAPSNIFYVTTPKAAWYLGTPTNLSASLVGTHQINLSWQDNAWSEYGYTIQRSSNGGRNWTTIGTTGWDVTSFTDWYTNRNTTYTYRVQAFNDGSAKPTSNKAAVTTLWFGQTAFDNAVNNGADFATLGQQAIDRTLAHWNAPASERVFASSPTPRVVAADVTATQVLTASYVAPRQISVETLPVLESLQSPTDPDAYPDAVDHALSEDLQVWM